MAGEFEKLAYEAALRSLDKQEKLVEELRARTGVLLAASSLTASFLGQLAFRHPNPQPLALMALGSFVASIGISVFILVPRKGLVFAEIGSEAYDRLFEAGDDLAEVYRRLTYDLDQLWSANDGAIAWLARAYWLAAAALVAEVGSLSAILASTIF
jgi:hypothetical protein